MAIFSWMRRTRSTPDTEELPELETIGFYLHAEAGATASVRQVLRRLPVLVVQAFGIAWRASKSHTIAAVILNLISGAAITFGLLATRDVATALFSSVPTAERIVDAVPSLLVVALALSTRAGMKIASEWAQARLEPLVTNMVEARLYWLTIHVPLRSFDDDSFSDDVHRARDRGIDGAVRLVDNTIDVLTGLVAMIAVATAVAIIHPLLLVLLVVAAVPVAWSAVRSARIEYVSHQQRITRRRRVWMMEQLMASPTTAAEVRSYQVGSWLHGQYRRMVRAETSADFGVIHRQTLTRIAGKLAAGVATCGVYGALGWLLATGQIALAAGAAAVLALQQGASNMGQLTTATNEVYHEGLYFADYTRFVDNATARLRPTPRDTSKVRAPTHIRLEGVSLRYPNAETDAVSDVSVDINHGETVALVGANGSGKTSLAKVIATLYRPTAGSVLWDGEDVSDLDAEAVADHIAVVTQDYARWPFTARTNIALGRDGQLATVDPELVHTAARAADAHDMILKLPQGYDTLLDRTFKGGIDLSIGQWQRMACARGFYRDSPILICDEPSAALDPRAEAGLFDQLRSRAGVATTILITHRLANVVHADRILVLDDGHVVEMGTHSELLDVDGHYAELFRLQARHYIS